MNIEITRSLILPKEEKDIFEKCVEHLDSLMGAMIIENLGIIEFEGFKQVYLERLQETTNILECFANKKVDDIY